jgi:hypothetical protein
MIITTLQMSHQYARGGLFIKVVIYSYYNVRNAPFIYPNSSLHSHRVMLFTNISAPHE